MIESASPDALRLDDLPADLRQSIAAVIRRGLRVLRIPKPERFSTWAERNFYLSQESSYVEGKWVCWPPQRGLMDMLAHDEVHHFTFRKSARVGYTKILLAHTAYEAEHKRRNAVIYQPTDDDRDEFVTTELEPMLRDVACMRRVMPRFSRRSKDNTLRVKKFTTGLLHLRGGKAAKNYRRLTVDSVKYDEFDGFDRDIEKEGAPGKLGDKRTEGAVWPKSIAGTTPKLKGLSNIEDREDTADVHMRWHVPCIHCDQLHEITWGGKDKAHGIKWTDRDATTVHHVCPHCGGCTTQQQYLDVWHLGLWVCTQTGIWFDHLGNFRTPQSLQWGCCELAPDPATILPPPGHVAAHLWTACAPQASWQAIVEEFLAAALKAEGGDLSLLKTFVNTTLGELWEEKGDRIEEHALQARAETYRLRTVPIGVLQLTAGIDVQGKRWEIGVWGWGAGMESWPIDHHIIEGNPADENDWVHVAEYLNRRYTQAWHGGTLGIDATSIDSGHETQAVYNFVRLQQHIRRIWAIKGASEPGKSIKGIASPVEVNWRGQRWQHGVKVWVIGVDTAKDLLHGQLGIQQPGPGYLHFSNELPREWYEQLTAEQRITVRSPRGETQVWVKRRPRNEVLDCRNYALHAATMLGLDTYSQAKWQRLRDAVQPPRDLFNAEPLAIVVPASQATPNAAHTAQPAAVPAPLLSRPAPARPAPRRW